MFLFSRRLFCVLECFLLRWCICATASWLSSKRVSNQGIEPFVDRWLPGESTRSSPRVYLSPPQARSRPPLEGETQNRHSRYKPSFEAKLSPTCNLHTKHSWSMESFFLFFGAGEHRQPGGPVFPLRRGRDLPGEGIRDPHAPRQAREPGVLIGAVQEATRLRY